MVDSAPPKNAQCIVIVGGGAGGLELATRLGKCFRQNRRAQAAHRRAIHIYHQIGRIPAGQKQ